MLRFTRHLLEKQFEKKKKKKASEVAANLLLSGSLQTQMVGRAKTRHHPLISTSTLLIFSVDQSVH